jgi:hypothetical protein
MNNVWVFQKVYVKVIYEQKITRCNFYNQLQIMNRAKFNLTFDLNIIFLYYFHCRK